jgi:UDP-N-acetylmuramyl pentapeptide synthase
LKIMGSLRQSHLQITIQDLVAITGGCVFGDSSAVVTDVTHDSRKAGPGSLFVAVRGELFDAHKFIPQVMAQGAAGVISEQVAPADFTGAWLQVEDVRRAMALAAAEVQQHPSRELQLVGRHQRENHNCILDCFYSGSSR